MKTETLIHSNGSKWHGEEPASISTLINVLKDNTLCEMFFKKWYSWRETKTFVLTPITKTREGNYMFFGNFNEVSHVFRIETNDKDVISVLRPAIMANKGWAKYIHNCKNCKK